MPSLTSFSLAHFQHAILSGWEDRLKQCLEEHPDWVNIRLNGPTWPLHLAIFRDQTAIALHLIEAGADLFIDHPGSLSSKDYPCRTPIFTAVGHASPEVVESLLKRGVLKNMSLELQNSLLGIAAMCSFGSDISKVKLLVEHGIRIHSDSDPYSKKPSLLHIAVDRGNLALTSFLIDQGMDLIKLKSEIDSPKRLKCNSWLASSVASCSLIHQALSVQEELDVLNRATQTASSSFHNPLKTSTFASDSANDHQNSISTSAIPKRRTL